jgi:hypothetical protein
MTILACHCERSEAISSIRDAIQGAKYSENRRFCLEPTGLSSKATRRIKGLDAKFVTRAEQWNFFAYQRISRGLTME